MICVYVFLISLRDSGSSDRLQSTVVIIDPRGCQLLTFKPLDMLLSASYA